MDTELPELEKRLLSEPFNHDLRTEYADLLAAHGQWTDALRQLEILHQQRPDAPELIIRAARCELRLEQPEKALERYHAARNLRGFSRDPELEELVAAARSAGGPQLQVIQGGEGQEAKVLSFTRPEAEKVRFTDIVGMDDLKKTLRLQIVEPFKNPGLFARFRKKAGGGVLLYGPPGCGKTLMARAVASECEAEFIAIGISDVLNMWIGESERNLSAIFDKARLHRPSVLFFDELDALAFSRSKARSEHSRTIVNEFLAQLDGIDGQNDQVLVMAATNMPWDVDPAMKRPGRFSRQVFVPPPDEAAQAEMFRIKLIGVPCETIDCATMARTCHLFSGADIDGVIDLAKERVLAEILESGMERPLRQDDFVAAIERFHPSTLDWLKTARNLVKYAGADDAYREVEKYLKKIKFS